MPVGRGSNQKLPKHNRRSLPAVLPAKFRPVCKQQKYPLLNVFELSCSRLNKVAQFSRMSEQIINFNGELKRWKANQQEIKNIYATYYLYRHLFLRLKDIGNFHPTETTAKTQLIHLQRWFAAEKPKVRNQKASEQPVIESKSPDQEEKKTIFDMVQANILKREMEAYKIMARTTHTEFHPPADRLAEFRRKELFQPEYDPLSRKQSNSLTAISRKMVSTRHNSLSTLISFKDTRSSFHPPNKQNKPADIELKPTEEETDQALYNQLKATETERMVRKEDLMKEVLIQEKNEEDEEVIQGQLLQEENNQQRKKYQYDQPTADELMKTQETIKNPTQSTLRRVINANQNLVASKLQALDVGKLMSNWSKQKSRGNSEKAYRLQRAKGVSRPKQPSASQPKAQSHTTLYQSLKQQPVSLEAELQKNKIREVIKSCGKYLNHVEIESNILGSDEQRLLRATSLTAFSRRSQKKRFSQFMREDGGANAYNSEAIKETVWAKERLLKRDINIPKSRIYESLGLMNGEVNLKRNEIHPLNVRLCIFIEMGLGSKLSLATLQSFFPQDFN